MSGSSSSHQNSSYFFNNLLMNNKSRYPFQMHANISTYILTIQYNDIIDEMNQFKDIIERPSPLVTPHQRHPPYFTPTWNKYRYYVTFNNTSDQFKQQVQASTTFYGGNNRIFIKAACSVTPTILNLPSGSVYILKRRITEQTLTFRPRKM